MVWDLRLPREAGGQVTLCAEVAMVARGWGKPGVWRRLCEKTNDQDQDDAPVLPLLMRSAS